MTKKELIELLAKYPDDAEIAVFCECRRFSGIVDLNPNGPAVQLNTDGARKLIDNDDRSEDEGTDPDLYTLMKGDTILMMSPDLVEIEGAVIRQQANIMKSDRNRF